MKSVNQTKKAEIKMKQNFSLCLADSLSTYRIFVQIKIPNYVHFNADYFVNEIFVFFLSFFILFFLQLNFSILAFYSPSSSLSSTSLMLSIVK